MNLIQHQHPPTYVPTGDVVNDFRYAFEGYDADISPFLPADNEAAILDVGCGWGQCLYWLKLKGYENAIGLDIGHEQEIHGRALGLNVVCVDDPIKFLEPKLESFDLVVMNHVIEHVPADQGVRILAAIRESLKAGGRIVVQTPNMNAIGANAGRYIEISHVTGYTESSLHQLMGLAGFREIELFGNRTPFALRPRRIFWAILQKCSRLIWRIMLFAELGSDSPKIVQKNLYATALR